MSFIQLQTFNDYIGAHMLKGRLESAGIYCWLKDEYSVTIDPILANAVGGIKIMIDERDEEEAVRIMNEL